VKSFITEYDNAADDGAPYAGPTLLADCFEAAELLLNRVLGPNGERLRVLGELMERLPADRIHDTHTIVQRKDTHTS
jgi:hypothetical protein